MDLSFQRNLGIWDRIIRFVIGAIFSTWLYLVPGYEQLGKHFARLSWPGYDHRRHAGLLSGIRLIGLVNLRTPTIIPDNTGQQRANKRASNAKTREPADAACCPRVPAYHTKNDSFKSSPCVIPGAARLK